MKYIKPLYENKKFEEIPSYNYDLGRSEVLFTKKEAHLIISQLDFDFKDVKIYEDNENKTDSLHTHEDWIYIVHSAWETEDTFEEFCIYFRSILSDIHEGDVNDEPCNPEQIWIFKLYDEYYVVEVGAKDGQTWNTKQYKCDEIEGLIECINHVIDSLVIPKFKKNIEVCKSYIKAIEPFLKK